MHSALDSVSAFEEWSSSIFFECVAAPDHSSNNVEHHSVAFVYINYWEYLSHEKRIHVYIVVVE